MTQRTLPELAYEIKESVRALAASIDRQRLGLDANGNDRRGTLEQRIQRAKARHDSEYVIDEGGPNHCRVVRHL